MADVTTNYALPFLELGDPPDLASATEDLATAVDSLVLSQTLPRFASTAALLAALTPVRQVGMCAWADTGGGVGTGCLYRWDGTNWEAIQSLWQNWVPTWTAATTNPIIGNGTITGKWRVSGGDVEAYAKITIGTSTNSGAGAYSWTLPVTTHADLNTTYPIGQGTVLSGSTRGRTLITTGSGASAALTDEAGVRVSNGTPVAFSSTNTMSLTARYRPTGLSL